MLIPPNMAAQVTNVDMTEAPVYTSSTEDRNAPHQCAVDDEESGGGKRGQPGDHAAQDQRHGEHGDGEDDQAEGVAEDGGQKSGEDATKKAVPAVTSRPTVIHWYTWRMKTDATLILVDRVESRKLSIE